YMAYFDKRISAPMLLDMMAKFTDRTGYFEVATAYAKPSGEVKEYSFKVPFTLATEERGELQKGWSRLIILEGESRTLAEYPETDRIHIWNKNYLAIARDILSETS
ncbi:MAG TPA: non-canonical purine NTP pyrophosphatase, partial [Patescibacteria group bacterium]